MRKEWTGRCVGVLVLAGRAFAHGAGEAGDGEGTALWLLTLLGLGLPLLLYGWGLRTLWRRAGTGRGVPVWRALAFAAGLQVLGAALLGLDHAAHDSFAWHMAQHLLLILGAAPLLVLGAPLYVALWAAPLRWRRAGAQAWARRPALRAAWRRLTHPVAVWVLATAVFWGWHVPTLYEAAADNSALHALEHLGFLVTNGLFWWALLAPHGRRRLSPGAGVVFLFTTALQGSLLGALLTFARTPLYPGYAQRALARGQGALADQQLAGLVMWVPSGVVYVALSALFFIQWLRDEEGAQRLREAGSVTG